MKKIFTIITITIILSLFVTTQTQAKTVLISDSKCTYSFVQKHKRDTIYVYTYGTRINRNGDGKVRGNSKYNYIKYKKGKIGTKFTTICRLQNGAEDVDDIVVRIDYKGWNKPNIKLRCK